MTSTLTPYTYRPLSNPSAVRLIKILPDLEYSRVQCTIHHFDNPYVSGLRYHALSYVWGDPNPRRKICLGDTAGDMHRYPIHETIWEFLNKLWEGEYFDCYFWTDTLCLNQKDKSEINQQVTRMGEIYSAAEEVVSWIGDHEVSAKNPYWGRAWIMQEVVLAKKGRVYYGDMSIDLDDLLSQLESSRGSITAIQSLRKSQSPKVSLWTLLKGFEDIQSTHPLDKIYGILGLIEDEEGQPPTAQLIGVDYQKDVSEVFWDLVFECQHQVLLGEHISIIKTVEKMFPVWNTRRANHPNRDIHLKYFYADFQMLEAYRDGARTSELHASYATVALRVYDASLIFMHVLTSLKNWPSHFGQNWNWERNTPCKSKIQNAACIGFELTVDSTPKDILEWDAHKQIVDEWAELSRLTSWRCGVHYDRKQNLELLPEKERSRGKSIKWSQSNLKQIWEKLSSSCDAYQLYREPEDYKHFPRVCKEFSSSCDGSMMVFNMPDIGFRFVILSVEDQQAMFINLDRKNADTRAS